MLPCLLALPPSLPSPSLPPFHPYLLPLILSQAIFLPPSFPPFFLFLSRMPSLPPTPSTTTTTSSCPRYRCSLSRFSPATGVPVCLSIHLTHPLFVCVSVPFLVITGQPTTALPLSYLPSSSLWPFLYLTYFPSLLSPPFFSSFLHSLLYSMSLFPLHSFVSLPVYTYFFYLPFIKILPFDNLVFFNFSCFFTLFFSCSPFHSLSFT